MWKPQEDVGGGLLLKLEGDAHRATPPLSPSLWCWNYQCMQPAAAFIFKERDSLCSWNYVVQAGLKLQSATSPCLPRAADFLEFLTSCPHLALCGVVIL